MQPEERDPAHLWDLLEAARAIVHFCEGKALEDYRREELLRAAVEREFILVGEAARRLSEAFRTTHEGIPWRRIVGLRNVLIHRYEEIDDELMWQRVQREIPELIRDLAPLVPKPPDTSSES
jgi:uncharacterized protein with HEPN domain